METKKKSSRPYLKNDSSKTGAGAFASVECLPDKHKASFQTAALQRKRGRYFGEK
jgi:hypothetical protein